MASGSNPLAATSSFLEAIRSTIHKHKMFRPKDRVLIAVSGGPDSSALLTALVALRGELNLHLEAAYVDHGLRPSAVVREKVLVKAMARRFQVPLHILRGKFKKQGGESPEAAARALRYGLLLRCARSRSLSYCAVGHTLDDQAETVFLWLLRGTGTSGLAGIPPVRRMDGMTVVRPLLSSSRAEVESFLKDHGIKACEDRSNRSLRFVRNRIRLELLPMLEAAYNPELRRHVAQTAEILRGDLEYLKRQWRHQFHACARIGKKGIRLDRRKLAALEPSLRRGILRVAVERLKGDGQGFGQRHWAALEDMATTARTPALDLPHRIRARLLPGGWILLAPSGRLETWPR